MAHLMRTKQTGNDDKYQDGNIVSCRVCDSRACTLHERRVFLFLFLLLLFLLLPFFPPTPRHSGSRPSRSWLLIRGAWSGERPPVGCLTGDAEQQQRRQRRALQPRAGSPPLVRRAGRHLLSFLCKKIINKHDALRTGFLQK